MLLKNIQCVQKLVLTLLYLSAKTLAHTKVNSLIETIIITSVNNSADPCDDFYGYACGDYAEQHRSDTYKEITGLMDQQFNMQILNLMDSIYQHDYQVSDNCQSFVEKTRVYLKACRSESKRNVTKYFDEIQPGPLLNWPLLQQQQQQRDDRLRQFQARLFENNFNVWSLVGKLQSYGWNNVMINQEIVIDGAGKYSITLEPFNNEDNSSLPEPAILYVFLINLGIKSPERIIPQLQATNEQLLQILKIFEQENELNLDITFTQLVNLYPNINFIKYFWELLGKDLPADTVIQLKNPSYFQHLNDELSLSFKKTHLCNYLMLNFLLYLAADSTGQFKATNCVKDLRNKFDLAVNFLYYHHIYAYQARHINADIEDMFVNILNKMKETFVINSLKLTPYQVQFLLEKLSCVRLNIGNLPEDLSFNKIEEFYADVAPLDRNNYYKNHLEMLKHRYAKSLNYPQHQTHFIVTDNKLGSSSGPYYVATQNMIILPFGSLAPPMYDHRYHDLYKYSLLGFILAHELTHAFDTSGLHFNGQGLDDPVCLPSILKNKNFQLGLQCLQTQLPTDAIEERIADIVGMRTVYKVFVAKMNCLQPNFLNANWNKFFFLSTAQFFCGKKDIKFVDHDTDAERLNQIVMNSLGFKQAFNCPLNSKMNPGNKCLLY